MTPATVAPLKVTVFTLPIQGHVGALLPVVRALVDRGAEVEAFTSAAFAARLALAGARVHTYPAAGFDAVEAPSANFLVVAAMLGRLARTSLLALATDALRAQRPDVVLVDSMAPWGLLAARRLGIPAVTSTSSFVVHAGLGASPAAMLDIARKLPAGLGALASIARSRVQIRRAAGVDPGGPIGLLSNRGDATVVYTSRALQPGVGRLGADVQFVGATIAGVDAADPAEPSPGDAALLAAVGDGPLTYVALGTLYNDRPAFYRACIDALATDGRPLVVAVGRRTDRSLLGRIPPGVHVVGHAPQRELLRRAALFVTHGGMNSVHEALWHGVPMVVFPQAADQPVVGARIAALGAGRVLRGREPGVRAIREAATRVLAGGEMARTAERLGATLREGGGAAHAAELVAQHAGVVA